MAGTAAAIFPMWYFLTLYFQNVRGDSPLLAGLMFLPQTLAIVVASQLASRLIPRIGARPLLVAGPLVSALGLAWLAQISVDSNLLAVLVPGAIVTFGMGITFPSVTMAASAGVARAESGLVSGVVNTSRQVGASLGLAVLTTLAVSHSAGLSVPGASPSAVLTHGFGFALAVAGGITAAAAVAGLVVRPPAVPSPTPAAQVPPQHTEVDAA
jgi:MFS family permease